MHKFKEIMKDNAFMRRSVFIIFNVFLLYVLYFVIKNITIVTTTLGNGLSVLFSAFWPLILGLILAYLLNPLVSLIDNKLICKVIRPSENPVISAKRKKRSRKLSILLTFIIVFVAFVGIIYGFTIMIIGKFPISDLTNVMQDMLSNITTYEKGFKGWVANNFPDGVVYDKMMDFTNSIMGWLSENVSVTSVMAFFKGIGGSIVNFVIALIISIYLMADREFFLGLWNKFIKLLFPNKGQGVISTSLSDVNDVLSKFIRGALLDALIVATLSSIGLSLMGLEAAVFIGVFAGLANVIPYFGPVLGMIPAFLMGLATGGFWHGALAVLILFIIQQIDANIIYPRVVGTSTGLHPLMVLLAVSVFGFFGGILGMLIAVPIAGILQVFIVKWAILREKKIALKQAVKKTSEEQDTTNEK